MRCGESCELWRSACLRWVIDEGGERERDVEGGEQEEEGGRSSVR